MSADRIVIATALAVAREFGIRPWEVFSPVRVNRVALAKATACALIRDMSNLTVTEIGRIFGLSHPTVLHHIKRIEELTSISTAERNRYNNLKNIINENLHLDPHNGI